MSVLYRSDNGTLIDHRDFISKQYKSITTEQVSQTFAFTAKLFSVKSVNERKQRKRCHDSDELYEEATAVKEMYEKFINEIPDDIKLDINNKYNLLETGSVRDLSKTLFETTVFDHSGINGGNSAPVPLKCKVKGEYFLIPLKCRFFCGCVKEQCEKLAGDKFDIVIADPPWWNKYIRRLKGINDKLSYSMMYNEDIASIPVKSLLSDNCLVAVWCTNSPSNVTAVKDVIFPNWGVEYITTWYWMKVTIDLQPLCGFGVGNKKQPYERLMLGKVGKIKKIPEGHMFMSVPSALHSHKPPLLELLSPYVEKVPQVLELFARNLLSGTTSVGFEPLKWQHLSLYDAS